MTNRICILIMGLIFTVFFSILPSMAIAERQNIGRWVDEDPYAGSVIEIYKENKKNFMHKKYKDGSQSTVEIVLKAKSSGKLTYQELNPQNGEHYVINRKNQLEIRDNLGLITTARSSN